MAIVITDPDSGGGGGGDGGFDPFTYQEDFITAYQGAQIELQREIAEMNFKLGMENIAVEREKLAARIDMFEQQLEENRRQFNQAQRQAKEQFSAQYGLSASEFALKRDEYLSRPGNILARYGSGPAGAAQQMQKRADFRRRAEAGLLTQAEQGSGIAEHYGVEDYREPLYGLSGLGKGADRYNTGLVPDQSGVAPTPVAPVADIPPDGALPTPEPLPGDQDPTIPPGVEGTQQPWWI